jgi:hypothetical protein
MPHFTGEEDAFVIDCKENHHMAWPAIAVAFSAQPGFNARTGINLQVRYTRYTNASRLGAYPYRQRALDHLAAQGMLTLFVLLLSHTSHISFFSSHNLIGLL